MSRWEIALINIMIIIINKYLFYYLYIVFKTGTPIEWGNEYLKKTWHRYFYIKLFFIYAFMIFYVYITF